MSRQDAAFVYMRSHHNLVNNFNILVAQIMDDIAPVKTKLITGKTKAPLRNVEKVRT